MALARVFEAFVKESPVTVMLRGILEYALPPQRIDELFREHARSQYEDELLFSTTVAVLMLPVAGMRKSVNAAYQALKDKIEVSVTSLYNKLQGTELQVSRALVRETAMRLEPVIRALKATLPPPLPGLRLKIIDGNHLSGTEHRLTETRTLHSQPLPGQALVVLEPEWMLATDVFPCEDAYSQERSLLDDVLETVQPHDCWLADRNFCTTTFCFGIARRQAYFVIRQHGSTLYGKQFMGRRRLVGRCDTGVVSERKLRIVEPTTGEEMTLRRITVELDQPTSDGDTEIHILTNLPVRRASALKVADVYRRRWTIENAFQEIGQALRSELNTLCYPKAALLCFCVGLLLYNTLSALKAALRSVYGEAAQNLSGYYLSEEIGAVYSGMMIAIRPGHWTRAFSQITARQMANQLNNLAHYVNPARFGKSKRGPKQPPTKRTGGFREKHVSTARLLEARLTA
jgi:IS4 transposase